MRTKNLQIFLLSVTLYLVVGESNFYPNYQNMLVRLSNENGIVTPETPENQREGRVEVSFDAGQTWGTVCSTNWTLREGNVVCRQLNLGYASSATSSTKHGSSTSHPWAMVGTLCRGNERRLADCFRESKYPQRCNAQNQNISTVACITKSPDLKLSLPEISASARLAIVPLSQLTCAMEENCLASEAYRIVRTQPNATRYLLRFDTLAQNVGTKDFSPYANYDDWQWHECHQHYHSMEEFAWFGIYSRQYKKVAEGHKASFCLMDTNCIAGVRPRYTCSNMTQGISIGCGDLYSSNLDCQWVDVTGLAPGQYILRVVINPSYMIGEISFENNGAECDLNYTGNPATTKVTRCVHAPLWFNI